MKSILKNIAAALTLIVILFAGCENPAKDVEIIVNTDIFKSPTLIQFVNAKQGIAGPQDFTVTITGANANLVRTTTGGKVFKASSGLLNLVLDRNASPSPTNPVKFTVIANAAGFAPVFQDVVITSATDPSLYRVKVAEYTNPAVGSSAIVVPNTPISNGTSNSDITITTPVNAGIVQKTDITISTGTSFLDATGATISGSQLESRVLFAGRATNGTTPVAPGGNFGSNVIGINGQPIAGGRRFYSAGSVSIDMFAGGKEVKTFSKPVIVDMEVSPTMINPTTKQVIKVGETIPMWSLNDNTGQWKAEGNATFIINAAGKLAARMPITHLSQWMDAYEFPPNENTNCTTTIVVNRPASEFFESFIVDGFGYSDGSQPFKIITFAPGETTKTVAFVAETYESGAIFFRPWLGGRSGGPTYVNNNITSPVLSSFCGQTTTFNLVAAPDVINASVYVRVKCSGKDLVTGINAIITITPIGSPPDEARVYNLVKGNGFGSIINGVTYKIVAAVDGKSYTSQFTASKDNFVLPSGFDLVGTAEYRTFGKTLYIDGLVTKTDCK